MKLTYFTCLLAAFFLAIGCTAEQPNSSTAVSSSDAGTSAPTTTASTTTDSSATETAKPATTTDETPVADADADLAIPDDALSIGSKAPALEIEHWVSDGNGEFEAVTEFAPDKVYVVEFWATWCGPCVRSMPHLAELQEKYKDSVQIISVSNEDMETVNDFLAKPYSSDGETESEDDEAEENDGPSTYGELTSVYCLTTDPDRSVGTDYMVAAGQNGIPACFVVGKTGLIEWIGHPMALDQPLAQIVDGTWNRESFAKEFQEKQMVDLIMGQIFEAAQSGDLEKAHQLIAKAKSVAPPSAMQQIESMEMQLKMAPIAKLMQEGNVEAAITAMEALLETVEGPMKQQLNGVLEQLKASVVAAEEAASEEESDDDAAE